jgi:hypothetical protein
MAGRKQHYIPQALLRGFLINRRGNDRQVLVYRAGRKPYEASTKDVAAERFFYSERPKGDVVTLDDQITDYENRLAQLLGELKSAGNQETVNSLVAAEVVAHLVVRGAFVRDMLRTGGGEIVAGLSMILADPEAMRDAMRIDEGELTPALQEAIEPAINAASAMLPERFPKDFLWRIVRFHLREVFDGFAQEFVPGLRALLGQLLANISDVVRAAHAKAMGSQLPPQGRVDALASLRWSMNHTPTALILPDCVALAFNTGGSVTAYLLGDAGQPGAVLVPLASNRLLIGSTGAISLEAAVREFNDHAARCSWNFFVASERTERLASASDLIGSSSKETVASTIEEVIAEHRAGLLSASSVHITAGSGGESLDNHVASIEHQQGRWSYSVQMTGASETEAQEISTVVAEIVNACAQAWPLQMLDAVIFADDYEGALRQLERGFTASQPLTTSSAEIGVGVAMSPLVLREGKVKVCVVMRAQLGVGLLSKDEKERNSATQLLVTMLAEVAHYGYVEAAIPGHLLQPLDSEWDRMFFGPMDGIPSAYLSTRMAAGIDLGEQDVFRQLAIESWERSKRSIDTARSAFRTVRDVDRVLLIATTHLATSLTFMARDDLKNSSA